MYSQEEIEHAHSLDFKDLNDSIVETVCGCQVKPDGECPYGNHSPLLVLGVI